MGRQWKRGWQCSGLAVIMLAGLGFVSQVHADTALQIVTSQKAQILAQENACTSRLNDQNTNHAGDPQRTRVNNSGPYAQINWISNQGSPSSTNITVPSGTTSVPLQLNQMEFICAIVVKNNTNSSHITDGGSIVTNGNFPRDRAPNPDNGNINSASLVHANTQINSASATVNGVTRSLAAPAGGWAYLSLNRNNASRYWLANAIPFTYTPVGPLTADQTVTINFNVTSIVSYHTYPGTTQCTSRTTGRNINVQPTDFSSCRASNIRVSFVLHVVPPPVCGGAGVNPATVDPTSIFTVTAKVVYANPATAQTVYDAGGRVYVKVTGPLNFPQTSGGTRSGATLGYTTGAMGPPPPGSYTIDYGVSAVGPFGNVTCHSQFTVGYRPYFDVLGGDAVAGLAFKQGNNCTQLSSGTAAGQAAILRSWNYDGNPGYYGAGTQLGAFALGQISSFVSGLNPTAPAGSAAITPANPYDLSFANRTPGGGAVVNAAQAKYGGGFGAFGYCADDYAGSVTSGITTWANDYATSGTYNVNGPLTLAGGTLQPKTNITIKVTGDVYINGDITYNYAAIDQIPKLSIYATGNIYVGSAVGQLHGVFVAQNGAFATCASGPGTEAKVYNLCNRPLHVYGAVAAQAIHLDRSFGSLHANAGPAETFQYGPELWLGGSENCGTNPAFCLNTEHGFASYTSLPPVL